MARTAPDQALSALESAFALGDVDEIRRLLIDLEESHGADARVKVARARLAAAEGDAAAATATLRALTTDRSDGGLARAYLGSLLVTQGKAGEGREHLEAALAAGVDVAPARYSLGIALLDAGETRDAVPHLASAVERMSGSAPAWFALGVAMARLGQLDRAAEALDACVKADPGHEDAYIAASQVALGRGQPEQARALLRQGLVAQPKSLSLLRASADVETRLGDAKAALEALQKVPAADRNPVDLVTLSLMSLSLGDVAGALQHAEAAVNAAPALWSTHYAHGMALEGKTPMPRSKVLAAYRKAVELGDATGEAGTRLGFVLMEDEAPSAKEEAITVLEGAVERSGRAPGAQLNLALAYARAGREQDARGCCEAILAHPGASPSEREQAERLSRNLQ